MALTSPRTRPFTQARVPKRLLLIGLAAAVGLGGTYVALEGNPLSRNDTTVVYDSTRRAAGHPAGDRQRDRTDHRIRRAFRSASRARASSAKSTWRSVSKSPPARSSANSTRPIYRPRSTRPRPHSPSSRPRWPNCRRAPRPSRSRCPQAQVAAAQTHAGRSPEELAGGADQLGRDHQRRAGRRRARRRLTWPPASSRCRARRTRPTRALRRIRLRCPTPQQAYQDQLQTFQAS